MLTCEIIRYEVNDIGEILLPTRQSQIHHCGNGKIIASIYYFDPGNKSKQHRGPPNGFSKRSLSLYYSSTKILMGLTEIQICRSPEERNESSDFCLYLQQIGTGKLQ
jgi:hypothetical protein